MATTTTYCEAQLYAGTYFQPAEYCEEEAAEGSEYCQAHADAADAAEDAAISWAEDAWLDERDCEADVW